MPCNMSRTLVQTGAGHARQITRVRTYRNMAQIDGSCPQAPHAPGDVGEVLEQLQVGRPRVIVLVAKPCHL